MNTIFVTTLDGIIKATVKYNTLWKTHQINIDGELYGEYPPNQEAEAIESMMKSFSDANIIKPQITLLISEANPLSNQLEKITGDGYNALDYEHLYQSQLIKHIKTGLIIQTIAKREIKQQMAGYPITTQN